MEKRQNDFGGPISKKPRLANDVNDLWGEDIDVSHIDFEYLATQVDKQTTTCVDTHNESILPSYTDFKQKQQFMFTSTQSTSMLPPPSFSQFCAPSTSNNVSNLEKKIKSLEQQLETKQGEVSILQSQIKTLNSNKESERLKNQQECSRKVADAVRDMNTTKSELEFKNLEIANLKQKITELSKIIDHNKHNTKIEAIKSTKLNENNNVEAPVSTNILLHSSTFPVYPLKNLIPSSLSDQDCLESLENLNFYARRRENSQFLANDVKNLFPKTIVNGTVLSTNYIMSDITYMSKLSIEEINMPGNYKRINKIINVCHQLLHNFHKYIQTLKSLLQPEDIQKEDALYLEKKLRYKNDSSLVFGSGKICENEIGIPCRRILAFIAELLLFSQHLQEYLLNNKVIDFGDDEKYIESLTIKDEISASKYNWSDNYEFINLLCSIVNTLGQSRKANKAPGLLLAITSFISKVAMTPYFQNVNQIVMQTFKNVVFSRPPNIVVESLATFLKNTSHHSTFVTDICHMASKQGLKTVEKQGIVYFNNDSCVFQVFCTLYEEKLLVKVENHIASHASMLVFALNVFATGAEWLYYQENNNCECLLRLLKLCIGMIYKCVAFYSNYIEFKISEENFSERYNNMRMLLRNGIEVLSRINSRCYYLIEKSIATFSEYKKIIIDLLKMQDVLGLDSFQVECLKNMNVIEDMPDIKPPTKSEEMLLY